MAWFSDDAIIEAFPSAEGLSPAALGEAVRDATRVYEYVVANPGLPDPNLRAWGESCGIAPDRMNVAIALLRDGGLLFSLPDQLPGPTPAPDRTASPVRAALAAAFTASELRKAASRVGADVPKSASKDELVDAVAIAAGA